jgi:hypothetical protein
MQLALVALLGLIVGVALLVLALPDVLFGGFRGAVDLLIVLMAGLALAELSCFVDPLVGLLRMLLDVILGLLLCISELTHAIPGVLESESMSLSLVVVPERVAATIDVSVPPVRRDRVPVKLAFPVKSIEALRPLAAELGGLVDPTTTQRVFRGSMLCDGIDPEGNVIQLLEPSPKPFRRHGARRGVCLTGASSPALHRDRSQPGRR